VSQRSRNNKGEIHKESKRRKKARKRRRRRRKERKKEEEGRKKTELNELHIQEKSHTWNKNSQQQHLHSCQLTPPTQHTNGS
jgi:hypothetical protein